MSTLQQSFNRRVAGSKGDEQEVRDSIKAVRNWGAGKTGPEREEFARTAWFLSHRTKSLKSTASFSIHAFPDVTVNDIQRTTGHRTPVSWVSRSPDDRPTESVEGRPVRRSQKPVLAPVKGEAAPTTLVRLTGGWKAVQAMYDCSEEEARLFLEQLVDEAGQDPVDLDLRWVNAPWNGHRVLRADFRSDPIGYLPEETAEAVGEKLAGRRKALLLVRGKTVYATLSQ